MNRMFPHQAEWALTPDNAHPNARSLLTQSYYWDCCDDDSPLGNDTGADILTFYSEAIFANANLEVVEFLESVLTDWEMLINNWSLTDEAEIQQQMADNPYAIRSSDDAVIALAFAMYVMHGQVNAKIRDLALIAVDRESTETILRGWSVPEERSARLIDFKRKLNQMQIAP